MALEKTRDDDENYSLEVIVCSFASFGKMSNNRKSQLRHPDFGDNPGHESAPRSEGMVRLEERRASVEARAQMA